jgi:hypothetical protein
MKHRNVSFSQKKIISDTVYEEAERRAKLLPIREKSYRGPEANLIGCLGEVLVEHWMSTKGIRFVSKLNNTKFDYLINDRLRLEIKTKDRTCRPKIDFDNSAPLYNHAHQRPDYFLFVSLQRDKYDSSMPFIRRFKTAFIVGGISCNELDRVGIPFLEDEEDWRNRTSFWTDCLNVEMWQLVPLSEMTDILKGVKSRPREDAAINVKIIEEMRSRIADGLLKPRKFPCEIRSS